MYIRIDRGFSDVFCFSDTKVGDTFVVRRDLSLFPQPVRPRVGGGTYVPVLETTGCVGLRLVEVKHKLPPPNRSLPVDLERVSSSTIERPKKGSRMNRVYEWT